MCNKSREITHGPVELGGFNIPHLYAIQGAMKLKTLFNNIQSQSELGKLLIININWLKLTVGWSRQIFQDNRTVPYIKENLLLNLKEFMDKCQITLKSKHFWIPKVW